MTLFYVRKELLNLHQVQRKRRVVRVKRKKKTLRMALLYARKGLLNPRQMQRKRREVRVKRKKKAMIITLRMVLILCQ